MKSFFKGLLSFSRNNRDRREYIKPKIKDLNQLVKIEASKINDEPENFILDILQNNEEHIIIYRTKYDLDQKYGLLYINLKIINKKGILLNRIRLIANYTHKETIEINDIEVFGENQGRGYGSLLLNSLINFALANSVKVISGWISNTDIDSLDMLEYFYKKHGFNVILANDNKNPNKVADIIWTNT